MGAADFQRRLGALRDQFAVAGEARELVRLSKAGERGRAPGRQRARATHVHIHSGIGRGHMDVEWLACRLQYFGDRPGRLNGAVEAGAENRTAVDGDDVVRARRGEADFQQIMGAATRMQGRAPAALPMRIDQRLDRRDQPGVLKRLHHQRALPKMIFGQRPVLHGAAAALAEMLADRRCALVTRLVDMDQMTPVGVPGDRFDRDHFARQRVGHIDRPNGCVGNAVAAMAEALNRELFGHARLYSN